MVILFKVALPLTPFKVGLVFAMMGVVLLGFITPIGRYIFTLSKLTLMQWGLSIITIVASAPVLAIVVKLIRVRRNVEQ